MFERRNFSDSELWAFFGTILVISFFAFSGSAIYFSTSSSADEAKAKSAAIQSLAESGKTAKEIQEVMATWDKSSKSGQTTGDKRAELTKYLINRNVSSSEIPKIVDACFKDDDFINAKTVEKGTTK